MAGQDLPPTEWSKKKPLEGEEKINANLTNSYLKIGSNLGLDCLAATLIKFIMKWSYLHYTNYSLEVVTIYG